MRYALSFILGFILALALPALAARSFRGKRVTTAEVNTITRSGVKEIAQADLVGRGLLEEILLEVKKINVHMIQISGFDEVTGEELD